MNNNKVVEVCDNCSRACCWYGESMCDYADSAGTKLMTVKQLKKLNLEHEDYWSDEKMLQIYGDKNPFSKEVKSEQ